VARLGRHPSVARLDVNACSAEQRSGTRAVAARNRSRCLRALLGDSGRGGPRALGAAWEREPRPPPQAQRGFVSCSCRAVNRGRSGENDLLANGASAHHFAPKLSISRCSKSLPSRGRPLRRFLSRNLGGPRRSTFMAPRSLPGADSGSETTSRKRVAMVDQRQTHPDRQLPDRRGMAAVGANRGPASCDPVGLNARRASSSDASALLSITAETTAEDHSTGEQRHREGQSGACLVRTQQCCRAGPCAAVSERQTESGETRGNRRWHR
jgi:hypothetical protein